MKLIQFDEMLDILQEVDILQSNRDLTDIRSKKVTGSYGFQRWHAESKLAVLFLSPFR